MIIDCKIQNADSEFDMASIARAIITKDQIPSDDEYFFYIYDGKEDKFLIASNEDPDRLYECFQGMCDMYMEKAYKPYSPYTIKFPRGYFTTDENDEPIEDYGDLLMVWRYNKPFLFVQMHNPEYY